MSETPNGQLADGSLRCWIYGKELFPEGESVPIFSTPTREQIFLITASAIDLVQVCWGCESHCDPGVKMARRPEIIMAAERLRNSFGELWGSREFIRPKQPPGRPEEIDGHIFHIYDLFYSAYGCPDHRRVDLHEKSEPLEDLNQSESPRNFAMKRLYASAAADKMFAPLENHERLSKIEAAARRLLDLVAIECSPAFLWEGTTANEAVAIVCDAEAPITPPDHESPAEPTSVSSETIENRALAMALHMVKSSEKLSITKIAKALGCQRTFLYRCPEFQAFIKSHNNGPQWLPRGRKDRQNRDLDAWDNVAE